MPHYSLDISFIKKVCLPWAKHRSEKDVRFPLFSSETFVDSGRDVSGRGAEANEEDHGARHQGSAVGWRQEAQASKYLMIRKHP